MNGGAWWAAVCGVAKSRTRLSDFTFVHWRRKWQPTPVISPGESQGRGSLVGCRLWGRTESDTTEATKQQQQGDLLQIYCVWIWNLWLLLSYQVWRVLHLYFFKKFSVIFFPIFFENLNCLQCQTIWLCSIGNYTLFKICSLIQIACLLICIQVSITLYSVVSNLLLSPLIDSFISDSVCFWL